MKRPIFVVLSSFLLLTSNIQAQTFSFVLEPQGEIIYARSNAIFQVEDEIFCFHIKSNDGESAFLGSTILNNQGSIVDENIIAIGDQTIPIKVNASSNINEDFLVATSIVDDQLEYSGVFGYSIAENDSIWFLPVHIPDQIVRSVDVHSTENGEYLLLISNRATLLDNPSYSIVRFNSDLDVLSINPLDDQIFQSKILTDFIIDDQNEIIITGRTDIADFQDVFLIKVNMDFETIQSEFFGGPWGDSALTIDLSAEGYLVSGFYSVEDDFTVSQSYVSQINQDFSLNWESLFYPVESDFSVIYDSDKLPNGDIVSVGFTEQGENRGLIIKHNALGDLIWARILTCNEENTGTCDLRAVEVQADGSILASGFLNNQVGESYGTWIVKLDEEGCLEPNCENVSTEELSINDLTLYPNPTSSNLFLNTSDLQGLYEFEIISAMGKVIAGDRLFFDEQTSFDLSNYIKGLSTGMYFLSLKSSDSRLIKQLKFLKH